MNVSEVVVANNYAVLDAVVVIFLAGLIGVVTLIITAIVDRETGWNEVGPLGVSLALFLPVVWAGAMAEQRWRPVSGAEHEKSVAAAEEAAVKDFWREYVSHDGTLPSGPLVGQELRVQLEVTRVEYGAASRGRRPIRVEGVDGKGRMWVFYTAYRPEKRNPMVSDQLVIDLILDGSTFRDGYVIPERINWESSAFL